MPWRESTFLLLGEVRGASPLAGGQYGRRGHSKEFGALSGEGSTPMS